jgi:hypothetical protein
LSNGQLELLKWVALVGMFADHFAEYLLGWGYESLAFAAGRLAYPLFAFVLACNLARPGDRATRAKRTLVRLLIAFAISTPAAIWARGNPQVLNIFATLSLGTAVCWLSASNGQLAWRIPLCVALLAGAEFAEFGLLGVALVPTAYLWQAHDRRQAGAVTVALLLALAHFNGTFGGVYGYAGTLAVIPLVWMVRRVHVAIPRARWFFYAAYPVHLAIIGALNEFEFDGD